MQRISSDKFELTMKDILNNVGKKTNERTPLMIHAGVKKTASYWRRNAKKIWGERTGKTYRKNGKDYQVGNYARSIRSHMLDESPGNPVGEVGAPNMPGLPHLLEKGHAKVGGGRVRGIEHIWPATVEGFAYTMKLAEAMLDEVLHES